MALYEFPASFAQRRMWLIDKLDPGQPTYNVGWAVWLDGPLDEVALGKSWAGVVGRHEALRTTFRDDGGTPIQVIDDEFVPAGLAVVSLLHVPQERRESEALEAIRDHARAPFELDRGPLVRTSLLRLSEDRHVLSLVAHHAIADGWSFRLLFDEIAADYEALLDGRPPASAEPALQYADFALWELEHADAGGHADAIRFWRTELADAPHELVLPVDHPYPTRQGFAAAELDVSIDASVATGLRRLAAARGTTMFAVLIAAYAALLSRLSGADDLLIGVPCAARTRPEIEPVVGMFANTLAIRALLTDDPTLGQLVDRLHATIARAQEHQDLPFDRVVELCRPERHPARSPLVQVMCSVDDGWPVLGRGALRFRPELVPNGTGKFELELTIVDSAAGLGGHLRYRTDLFTVASARRFVDGLSVILSALADGGNVRVSDVDILPPATRDLVTRVWPAGVRDVPAPATLPPDTSATMLVAGACAGDHVVIEGTDITLTGAQLRTLADRIAAGLLARGVRVQDTVGIVLPRGARVLPALLGVWWVGAAYLPLDPTHPWRRLRGMLADAGVRVVITDRTALAEPLLAELDESVTVLDLAEPGWSVALPDSAEQVSVGVAAGSTLPRDVPPTAAAYVLFTSGTTGRPKAVTVTHGAVAHLLHAFRGMVPLGPADRVASVTTFAFDIALLDLLLPLLCGASIVVADADQAIDGVRLRRLLEATGVTALQATPTTWRMLVAAGGVPAGVRLRLSGGEALPRDLAEALLDGHGDGRGDGRDVRLWNLYGPTETTVYSAGGVVDTTAGPLDIGSAIAGTRIYLLDRWMRPVAPGVIGEVYVGGAGVGRGYAGAPGLTAERYLPDSFTEQAGDRLYRTGDLGRWRPTGRIEILGRADRQVKVRGYRVETAEIEAVLRGHPDVSDAAVTTWTGADTSDARLVGYVVTRAGAPDPPTGLGEHLRAFLPDYMVPATYVALPELPRTTSGKVDHRALPQPRWGATPVESKVAPRTQLERELTDLVANLLGLPDPVGVMDNFFVLGGHSVTATQLMARVWTNYGVDLPVRKLFDDPTMAGLAAAVTAAIGPADKPDPSRITIPSRADGADYLDGLTDHDVDELLATMTMDDRPTNRNT